VLCIYRELGRNQAERQVLIVVKIHPSILVKETIEKFGYDPRKIGKWSKLHVLRKCLQCGDTHSLRFVDIDGGWCHKCRSRAHCARITQDRTITRFQKSLHTLADVWFSFSVIDKTYRQGYMSRVQWRYQDVSALMNWLGIREHSPGTVCFKRAALKKAQTLSKQDCFKLLTYIFEKKRKLVLYKNILFTRDLSRLAPECSLVRLLLHKIGGESHLVKGGNITIDKGSFFVNGRWWHVG
jgi:hypothetical protein